MKIRVLIADDERIAREGLRARLEGAAAAAAGGVEVEVVGECANGVEAVSLIRDEKPDLVFLDVQMPGLDGFGVIESIGARKMPAVIFVTAYDRYALRAFEVYALDYLLKPYDEERFRGAFERAAAEIRTRRAAGGKAAAGDERVAALLEDLRARQKALEDRLDAQEAAAEADAAPLERIPVKKAGRIFFVETKEVGWLEAADNYVKIHVAGGGGETHLVRAKIGDLENRLDAGLFLRIHRSLIVNTRSIRELQPMFDGVFVVVLKDGTRLTSGRHFRRNFRPLLNE